MIPFNIIIKPIAKRDPKQNILVPKHHITLSRDQISSKIQQKVHKVSSDLRNNQIAFRKKPYDPMAVSKTIKIP